MVAAWPVSGDLQQNACMAGPSVRPDDAYAPAGRHDPVKHSPRSDDDGVISFDLGQCALIAV